MSRYRKLSPTGDYMFGHGELDFFVNSPELVAQSILTRLSLNKGAWFLNLDEGTPYDTAVLGSNTSQSRDAAIRNRIAETPGVLIIDEYNSEVLPGRRFRVTAKVTTIYGIAQVDTTL